jgi:probable HAF family extracellular repeat protein
MNATLARPSTGLTFLACSSKLIVAGLFLSIVGLSQAQAPLSYTVTDFGTLGGSTSTASAVGSQQATNKAGMRVGSSTTGDNSEHAFLFVDKQMYDLNLLCDLSTSDFKVLTVAKTIDDCGEIVGEGITINDEKHAFLLTPTPVDGGNWCYTCCKWVWKQEGGGWQWDTDCHCYTWHGPPGPHDACPPQPPHCWWWPLPCPDGCGCDPHHPWDNYCYCCINGQIYVVLTADCQKYGGQCFPTLEEATNYCRPKECWACIDGKVVKITDAKGGKKKAPQCYPSEEEAIRNCKPCWWCCLDGKIFQTTWADCQNKGGQCYPTKEEAQAHQKECIPCWVCLEGKPVQMSQADAKARDLQCYPSAKEAQANCKGWCCLDGQVFPSTPEDCKKKGGQYFATQQDADAYCKKCWCCFMGREGKEVVQTTKADCKRRQGQCYSTPEEAAKYGCIPKKGWCCLNGEVFPSTLEDCQKRGGKWFATQQDANAYCKECWCCMQGPNGKIVVKTTVEDCQQRRGQCYDSQAAANANCEKPCWCCITGPDGKKVVLEMTPENCHLRKGQCYASKDEAQKNCTLAVQYWVCRDLPTGMGVVQVTSADCQGGAQCYGSEQEAIAHCNPCYCCTKNPDGTYSISYGTETDCRAKSGGSNCHPTKEEAEAYCKPDQTWCCVYQGDRNGGISFPATAAQCAAKGGQLFASEQEARRRCRVVYCCYKDRGFFVTVEEDCKKQGGQCYDTVEEATKACGGWVTTLPAPPPPPGPPAPSCWCCIKGPVARPPFHTTRADCQAKGGQCYDTQDAANKACGATTPPAPPPPPTSPRLCWACIDGKVTQLQVGDTRAKRTQCYGSEEEARAHCTPKKVWCCMDGQVVQMTEEECRARNGHAYRTEQEARRNCKGKTCWVCIDGKVSQVAEEQARARGLQCFSSKAEATRNCHPKETCWCCVRGQVVQATEEECRAKGGQCYGSRKEALMHCRSEGPGGGNPRSDFPFGNGPQPGGTPHTKGKKHPDQTQQPR